MKKFSHRETTEDFRFRKEITYAPTFAKAAINDVRNSIFTRLTDVIRKDGPLSYQLACEGLEGGVDKAGNTMNGYMGLNVLSELLVMKRVGIYVDMPQLGGETIADKGDARPYMYMYRTEQIRSWTYHPEDPELLTSVLLEQEDFVIDEETGLTVGIMVTYRHVWLQDGGVICRFYNTAGEQLKEFFLDIDRIPFVIAEISSSLMADVANYQIALLNLESSDLSYVLKANYPFYVEQFDPRSESLYLKQPGKTEQLDFRNQSKIVSARENIQEIATGVSSGRRYPIGTERPAFINPSDVPLKASMDKSEQIKRDIRLLINLSIQNLQPRRSSAESKIADERPLESGLSYIGLELERVEKLVSYLWSAYEGSKDIASVKYPQDYSLKSEEERKSESNRLTELLPKIASPTLRRELMKRIASLNVGHKTSYETLDEIYEEIDDLPSVGSDPDSITQDLENGLVSLELASKIRGYPSGQVELAKEDHAERIERIAMAQTAGEGYGARGAKELDSNPKSAKEEKQSSREDGKSVVPTNNGRGEGK